MDVTNEVNFNNLTLLTTINEAYTIVQIIPIILNNIFYIVVLFRKYIVIYEYNRDNNTFNEISNVEIYGPGNNTNMLCGFFHYYTQYNRYGIIGITVDSVTLIDTLIYIIDITDILNPSLWIEFFPGHDVLITDTINGFTEATYNNEYYITFWYDSNSSTQINICTDPYAMQQVGGFGVNNYSGKRCSSVIQDINYPLYVFNTNDPGATTQPFNYLTFAFWNGTSFNVFSSNTVVLTGISNWINFINSNSKNICITLVNNNTIYLYDMTNPEVSVLSQALTSFTKTFVTEANTNNAFMTKIFRNGQTDWSLFFGTTLDSGPEIGTNINISNVVIDKSYQNFYISGIYTKQLQLYSYTTTGFVKNNQIFNLADNNGFIAKATINGNFLWVIPFIGDASDIIQRMQYIDSIDQFVAVGYTESSSLYILEKQISDIFNIPTIVQSILNNTSTSTSFILTFDTNGILKWNSYIYSTEQKRSVNLYDVTVSSNGDIIVIGVSNSNIIKYNDSGLNESNQLLYSYIDTQVQENGFIYIFSSSGAFIQSDLINFPPNSIVNIQDIKVDSNLNRIVYFPNIYTDSTTNTNIYIYNKDGTLAKINTIESFTSYSYVIQYLLDSYFTDTDGNIYSQIVYRYNPNYEFYYNNLQNYNIFLFGNDQDTEINKNYTIRKNYYNDNTGATILLNTVINSSNVIKTFNYINNITGSNNYYGIHLGKSPIYTLIKYNENSINYSNNTFETYFYFNELNIGEQYYLTIPTGNTGINIIKVNNFTLQNNGQYLISINNVNELRYYQSGPFFSPYLCIHSENKSVFYNIQFFPSSIFNPQYYNIQLLNLTLPNRPLLNLETLGGPRYLEDLPFIYLSIYNVNDEDEYDPDIVNVVYDNTPLADVQPFPIFLIPVYSQGIDSNFVTYSSDVTPIIKFTSSFTNIRIRVLDPDGNPLIFDQSLTKPNDFNFLNGVLPEYLTNVYLRIALTKR
jgi:hypothetical protein